MKLKDKNIIITGGSLGIGLAVSKKCVAEGANVIIAARNEKDLNTAIENVNKKGSSNSKIYSLDVSSYDEIQRFKSWCLENYTEINGLVNCAGIYGPIGKTTDVDMKLFQEAININFFGTVFMCNTFAPIIKSSHRKKIVNYSGGGSTTPFPNYSAYAASKVATVRFTENLALELNEAQFDVNCVAPGFVATRMHDQTLNTSIDKVGEDYYRETKEMVEKGGVPPGKAAELTVFLLSEESDGISGKFISAYWDPWTSEEFLMKLRADKDFATVRRIDDKIYFKKT